MERFAPQPSRLHRFQEKQGLALALLETLKEADYSELERRVLANIAGKERIAMALKTFQEGGEFFLVDSQGPSVSDLATLGLVSKRYASSRRGNVKRVDYRNKSGAPIRIDGRVYQNGEFIDLY